MVSNNKNLYEIYKKNKKLYKNKSKTRILLFKANWCIYCKNFELTWDKLKKEMKNTNIVFKMYDIDNSKHQKIFSKYNIESFPTILKKNNKSVKKYSGDRTIKNLKEFILST